MLACNPSESFVIFLYDIIQWTSDYDGGIDGLGGYEALAGINAGDGVNSITIPGSQTPAIINVDQTSNVRNPGVWIFRVDGGTSLAYVFVHVRLIFCTYSIVSLLQYCSIIATSYILYIFGIAAPNPPVILSLTTIDSQSVQVTWRAPTQPNGVLISYTITYTSDNSSTSHSIDPYNGKTVSS